MRIVTWSAVALMLAVAMIILAGLQLLATLSYEKDQTIARLKFTPKGKHRRCKDGLWNYGTC